MWLLFCSLPLHQVRSSPRQANLAVLLFHRVHPPEIYHQRSSSWKRKLLQHGRAAGLLTPSPSTVRVWPCARDGMKAGGIWRLCCMSRTNTTKQRKLSVAWWICGRDQARLLPCLDSVNLNLVATIRHCFIFGRGVRRIFLTTPN